MAVTLTILKSWLDSITRVFAWPQSMLKSSTIIEIKVLIKIQTKVFTVWNCFNTTFSHSKVHIWSVYTLLFRKCTTSDLSVFILIFQPLHYWLSTFNIHYKSLSFLESTTRSFACMSKHIISPPMLIPLHVWLSNITRSFIHYCGE